MAKKYYQTFEVDCQFDFPLDMLRYDNAFPATERDAGKMHDTIAGHVRGETIMVGRFVSTKAEIPSIERWHSFGCRISNIETR